MPKLSPHGRQASVQIAIKGSIDDDGKSWVELIPTAEKARNGPWYFTVTRADLDIFAASVSDRAGRVPVDYDHEGDDGGSTRAAGWFTGEVEIVAANADAPDGSKVDHDSAWAQVEWTPRAVEEIKGGEFRFMSPVFSFHDKDQKTGLMTRAKEIVASTLTNRPFFTQMAPVMASDLVWVAGEGMQALSDMVFQALNPGGPEHAAFWVMDVAADKALVRSYDDMTTWVVPFTRTGDQIDLALRDEWVAAEQEWVAAVDAALQANRATRPFTPKENTMPNAVLAKTLGLPEDATDEQINEAATAATARAAALETENAELKASATDDDRVTKLEEELASERKERVKAEVKAQVDTAVREMRITPAQGEVFAEQFAENPDGLKAVLGASPAGAVKARLKGVGGSADDKTGEEEDAAIERAETVFASEQADGVDEEGLTLHVKAEAILAAEGKQPGSYTQDEYILAIDQASRAA